MNKKNNSPLPLTNRKAKLSMIHIAKKETGIDDEAYRALLQGAAGVYSAAKIEFENQFQDVMKAFENLGFKSKRESELKKMNPASGRNPLWITAKQERYIRGLWDLASREKSVSSLRAMIRRITGVDDISFLLLKDARKVILALRDITEKAGFDPDEKKPKRKGGAKCSS